MKKQFFLKYRLFLLFFGIGIIFLLGYFSIPQPVVPHLAIIPHFMLASDKVDAFYAFLKNQRYLPQDPDTIILISPNHYNSHSTTPQTICETSQIYFRNQLFSLTPFPGTACDEEIFFPIGNAITTNEHGIGEHLVRIKKYFPDVKHIIPLILPTHRIPPTITNNLLKSSGKIFGNLMIIASVDFSHYLPEATAQTNDHISITTLKSGTGTWSDFRSLDVDCPSCLYFLDQIAKDKQHANLYRRDSSSTILGRDMQTDNTSRVFMRYE